MAQSVELLLDPHTEQRIRGEWDLLGDAGLSTERRAAPSGSHRPHITLYAAATISVEADRALPSLVQDLALDVRLGACMFFSSPTTDRFVLVRQVVASTALLELQRRVAQLCGGGFDDHFGAGSWTPHVTLARRLTAVQGAGALELLGSVGDHDGRVTRCRRWDGAARVDREL